MILLKESKLEREIHEKKRKCNVNKVYVFDLGYCVLGHAFVSKDIIISKFKHIIFIYPL